MVFIGGGLRKNFYAKSGTVYSPSLSDSSTLVKNGDGTYLITRVDGTRYGFDSYKKLSGITDRFGNSILVDNTTLGTTIVTDSVGRASVITYDTANGRVSSIKDPAGNSYDFSYNTAGQLWKVALPAPSATETERPYWEYLYNVAGLMEYKIDPERHIVRYTYDSDGRVTESIDPNGVPDTSGSAVKDGHTKALLYTPAAGLTTFTEKDGGQWVYTYDPQTNLIKEKTDPQGKKYNFYYNPDNSLRAMTVPFDGNRRLTTFYTYDSHGNRLTETEPSDLSVYLPAIDPSAIDIASLAKYTPPIKTAFSYTYDYASNDRILSSSDLRGPVALTTTYQYKTDAEGYKVTTVTDPVGNVNTTRYNADGSIRDITDANGKVTTYSYYPGTPENRLAGIVGLLQTVTGPDGVVTSFTSYDKNGNNTELQVKDTDGTARKIVRMEYDSLNRLRKSTTITAGNPDIVTTFGYDNNGNISIVKDAEGHETKYEYDYQGKATKITDAQQHDTLFGYGAVGCPSCGGGGDQLSSLTDAKSQTTSYQYDPMGRLVLETDPMQKKIRYTYYDSGSLKEKIDATAIPEKVLITHYYDTQGRLIKKRYADNSEEIFTYDLHGNLKTASNANITYTFAYYPDGRFQSVTDNMGRQISNDQYDSMGQRKQVTIKDGLDQRVIGYTYDEANRPKTITSSAGTFTYGYDKQGRRSSVTYPNGITATYGYDSLDRLTGITHAANGMAIAFANYSDFDKAGNRKNKSTDDGTESYSYDSVYRLLQAITPKGTEKYTYDAVGNRLTGPWPKDNKYQYDAANRMTMGKLFGHDYDNAGNQISRIIPNAPDKGWNLTWDMENRLTKMEKTKGTEKQTVTFKYDPFGRRIEKKVATTIGGVSKTSTWVYVYDNDNIAVEVYTNDSGVAEKTWSTQGASVDEHLALERNGQTFFYHSDGLGSVTAITDQNKAIVQTYSYDSFGMVKPSTNFRNSYTYTGREWDKETGLYFYRARYYDPMDGRFLSKDPIGFDGGDVVLYGYVQNNPINYTDPTGEEALKPPKPPPTFPTLPPPPKLPPKPPQKPGTGCKAIFDTCMRGASRCGQYKGPVVAVCVALYLMCQVANYGN